MNKFLSYIKIPEGASISAITSSKGEGIIPEIIDQNLIITITAESGENSKTYTLIVDKIILKINNKIINIKNAPIITENVIRVPIRQLFSTLNLKCKVKGNTLTVYNNKINIIFTTNRKIAVLNGKSVTLPASVKSNNEIYIPIQFLCQKMGVRYSYNLKTNILSINTK